MCTCYIIRYYVKVMLYRVILYYIILYYNILYFIILYSPSSVTLQPGVGFGLLYNTPPGLSIPCSVCPFFYSHLSQVRGHVIQPSDFWSSSSSCYIQLSVHLFWNCGILHSFYVTKPSYFLAFNEPDNVLPFNYSLHIILYYIIL